MDIPKVIQQIWLDREESYNEDPPEKYKDYVRSWHEHHPDYQYKFWNMSRALSLLSKTPHLNFFLYKLRRHIERCDFLRYVILVEEGGIYVDMDFKCQKSIEPLREGKKIGLVWEPVEHQGGTYLSNSFMMSRPRDPFFVSLIEHIKEQYNPARGDATTTTGPRILGSFARNYDLSSRDIIDTCDIMPLYEKRLLSRPCKSLDTAYTYTRWNEGSNWAKHPDLPSGSSPSPSDIVRVAPLLFILLVGIGAYLITSNFYILIAVIIIFLIGMALVMDMNTNTNRDIDRGGWKYIIPYNSSSLSTKNQTLIPKVIYQTNESLYVPPGLHSAIQSWRTENPDFSHRYFTSADCRAYIVKNFPDRYVRAYDKLIPGAYKADFWRYCILYREGGVYADSAMVCLRPLKLPEQATFISPNDYGYKGGLYNAFIACTPSHPILDRVLEIVLERVEKGQYGPESLWPTGPIALGDAFHDTVGTVRGTSFTTYPKEYIIWEHKAVPEKKMGYVKDGDDISLILTKYPGAHEERKLWSKLPHYGDLWRQRRVYEG